MEDSDFDSDKEVSHKHDELLDAVRQLDKNARVKKPQRSEPSLQVSEFHLVKSGITSEDAITVQDLAKTLRGKNSHVEISKKISSAQHKAPILQKPLEKPVADRIRRSVGYENTKNELEKWNGIVARNRTAPTISFPLDQPSMKLKNTSEFVKRFRIQSELEKELAALEELSVKETEQVNNDEFPLTLEEILERRQEAAKLRAQQSYREAKAHRQNKIKSKKYHRIQRKEKIKKLMKEFEELQKKDPEAALEKLQQLDKTRAEERMTLRHKSTGQWAKSKQIRAKYDKESRQVLAEQLAISRELTQKVRNDDDDSENEDDFEVNNIELADKDNPWMNPIKTTSEIDEFISGYKKFWQEKNAVKQNQEIKKKDQVDGDNTNSHNIKVVDETPFFELNIDNEELTLPLKIDKESVSKKVKTHKKKKLKVTETKKLTPGTSEWEVSALVSDYQNSEDSFANNVDLDIMFDSIEDKIQKNLSKKLKSLKKDLNPNINKKKKNKNKKRIEENSVNKLALKNDKIKSIIDKPLHETDRITETSQNSFDIEKLKTVANLNILVEKKQSSEIDPNKYINVKPKHIKTHLPDDMPDEALDDSESEGEDQQQIISEAFADDDVVDDFSKEKEDEVKKAQPEDINLSLPGWGSWGGKDIKESSRKKRRFILKLPKDFPRRDENRGNVIIIEEKNPKIKSHLVNELPFPFTTVQDFEASIRAPIGREFVPEKVHKQLTEPSVTTKMGQIIEPMDEDALVKTENLKRKLPYKEENAKKEITSKISKQNSSIKRKDYTKKKGKKELKS